MTPLLPPPRGAPRCIPIAEVRAAVEAIRVLFQDVASAGGQHTPYFLDDQRKWAGQRVRGVADRVDDALLRQRLKWVADSWDQAFAKAPSEQGARAYSPPDYSNEAYRREDEDEARRLGEVADAACLDTATRLQCRAETAVRSVDILREHSPVLSAKPMYWHSARTPAHMT
jgi:hypothetical protein